MYSGTLVTSGQGVARVVATGAATEMGRIGSALQTLGTERTRLQHETDRVVRLLAVVALALCAVVIVGYGLARGSLVDGLLAGIALAMSLIPEEFPVVLTVFLALGAWRIARSHVLTRRIPAIEALGAATVLCVDKTGTLTQNRMSVARLAVADAQHDVDGGPLPSASTAWWSSACWPARSIRSTRWSGRSSSCTSSDCSPSRQSTRRHAREARTRSRTACWR